MSTLLKFKDGREITDVPSDWMDIINMVGGELVTTNREKIDQMKDAPYRIGDCILDCWQGVYWLCKQSKLLKEPSVKKYHYDGPAIVVGSGPSMDLYLDKLRKWQGKALIVCAHTTANRLVDHGITPDIVTPVERVNISIRTKIPNKTFVKQTKLPDTTYGGLPLVPCDYKRYGHRMLTCSYDPIFTWAGCQDAQIFTGVTSGSAAVSVAKTIATGPLYLVGLDIVGNHFSGYTLLEDPLDANVPMMCADGKERFGNTIKYRSCREIGAIAKGRDAYQCAPEGAMIDGMTFRELPDPVDNNAKLVCDGKSKNLDRFNNFQRLKHGVSHQLVLSIDKCMAIKKAEDMHCGNLFDPEYTLLGTVLFRSLFAQISMETRFGMPHHHALDWCKEAYRNAIEGIIGGADEFNNE